jgi:hypothetical protein
MDYPSFYDECRINPAQLPYQHGIDGVPHHNGKGNIPFTRHVSFAGLAIRVANVHTPLAMIWFFPLQGKGSDNTGRFCV